MTDEATGDAEVDPEALYAALREETGQVLIGLEDLIERFTIGLLTRGHVLLEGVPGVAKTTAANLFARASGLEYSRIQMTPDVLPADITGTHVYREPTGEFELRRGPVFANVVVADEINRATPKTQSALLEAMQERQVTIEGDTLELPEPFIVIATQNPLEFEGSLHPSQPLYMNGGLRTAGEALEEAQENGTLLHETDGTEVYELDATTQTLDETGEIGTTDCYLYAKAFDGDVYSIRTKSGREITVSENHPFLVNRGGSIEWVRADELRPDEYLVTPKTLTAESRSFPTHEEALKHLAEEYRVVREEDLRTHVAALQSGEDLSREALDDLRIACGWSKKDLAERVDGTYDQVLNYLNGATNPVGKGIHAALRDATIELADYVEAHRIHRFDGELSPAEAGFFIGFVLADGRCTESQLSVSQKTLADRLDEWVDLADDLGFEPWVSDIKGGRRAAVDSKPLVEYLDYRYDIDAPERLLDAPEAFRESFLEIFLLAESHYDTEERRITFVQKDRETTNLIAHLLLQFDIHPWIKHREDVYEIRIQGEDIDTYRERFTWRGEPPDSHDYDSWNRLLPLPRDDMERLIEITGARYGDGLMANEWYNAYTRLRADGGATTEPLARTFAEDMRRAVEARKTTDPAALATQDLSTAAKQCGLSITDIVDGTSLTKHAVWQAYEDGSPPEEAVEYVTETYSKRVREADRLTRTFERLVGSDVSYDPVVDIEKRAYEGPVIGLSVPDTHNYIAGFGACGINHNTFELPEAQRDRFQMKLTADLPEREQERAIIDRFDQEPELGVSTVEQVIDPEDLVAARRVVDGIHVADPVKEYILDLVGATREHPDIAHGGSPRASLAFLNTGKARAALQGRRYVIPDDVKALAAPVLAHRLVLSTDAELSDVDPVEVVEGIADSVEPPGAGADFEAGSEPAISDGGAPQDGDG